MVNIYEVCNPSAENDDNKTRGVPSDCHRLGQSRDSGKEDRTAGVSGEGMGDSIIKDGQWCEPHCLSPFK